MKELPKHRVLLWAGLSGCESVQPHWKGWNSADFYLLRTQALSCLSLLSSEPELQLSPMFTHHWPYHISFHLLPLWTIYISPPWSFLFWTRLLSSLIIMFNNDISICFPFHEASFWKQDLTSLFVFSYQPKIILCMNLIDLLHLYRMWVL